jgi:hypothetical protein
MPRRVKIVRAVVPYYFKSPYPYANSAVREPAIED